MRLIYILIYTCMLRMTPAYKHMLPSLQANFCVFDANGVLARAFNAINLTKGGLFGFVRSLAKHRKEFRPKYMCAVYDGIHGNFRRNMTNRAYKANRKPASPDLYVQLDESRDFCLAAGIPILQYDDEEADDVIASLVSTFSESYRDICFTIISQDKDLFQLIKYPNVYCCTPQNNIMGPEQVEKKFGVPPDRVVDYLSLVGDSADNIQGAPQIGPVRAAQLVKQYGTIEQIYSRRHNIQERVLHHSIESSYSRLLQNKELITLRRNVQIPTDLGRYRYIQNDESDNNAYEFLKSRHISNKDWVRR